MKLDKAALRSYFSAHREEILSDLFSLARIPSVRAQASEGAPFGEECRRALCAARALFEREGIKTKEGRDGSYALALYGDGETADALGIFVHTDVVPVGDGWIYTEPFEPILVNGCAVGRGVEDNKAGVVLALWTLKYLKEQGVAPARPVAVFLGAAEESGMEDIRAFLSEYPAPAISLVPDSGYPVCYGEKGIARSVLTAKTPFKDILHIEGGEAFNVVLDRVTLTLAADGERTVALRALISDEPRITLAEKDGIAVLTAQGVAAHASTPDGSLNAAYLLFSRLAALKDLAETDREVLFAAAEMLSKTDGSPFSLDAPEKDFSPLTAANGIVGMKDGCLFLTLDIRYGTAITARVLEERLAMGAERRGFLLRMTENKPGFLNPRDGREMKAILDASEDFSGARPEPFTMGGGTYARCLRNAYSVGTTVSYVADPFSAPDGHGGAHQADEHLPVDAFLEQLALFTDIVYRLLSL